MKEMSAEDLRGKRVRIESSSEHPYMVRITLADTGEEVPNVDQFTLDAEVGQPHTRAWLRLLHPKRDKVDEELVEVDADIDVLARITQVEEFTKAKGAPQQTVVSIDGKQFAQNLTSNNVACSIETSIRRNEV